MKYIDVQKRHRQKRNLFSFMARFLADILEFTRLTFPPIMRIETTNRCNARCSFCPRESMNRHETCMDQSLFEKIIVECAENGCSMIHMHGFGEPLLDPLLPERIRFAKRLGVKRVKIFTNGALLKGEMAKGLLASGLDEIKVSIDGADGQEFKALRVGLGHEQVLENVRTFKKMRDQGSGRLPRILATCTRTSNKSRTRKMVHGLVDRIIYADLHNWAGARDFFDGMKIRQPCFRLWQTLTVLVNGDVTPCCLDHAGREIIGSCRERQIVEIWKNERYRQLRDLHRDSEQCRIPLCTDCSMSYLRVGFL